jgi:hypothetical protein
MAGRSPAVEGGTMLRTCEDRKAQRRFRADLHEAERNMATPEILKRIKALAFNQCGTIVDMAQAIRASPTARGDDLSDVQVAKILRR